MTASVAQETTLTTIAAGVHLQAIKDFYRSCGYSGPTEPDDDVVLARLGQQIVGVVRLVKEDEHFLLRGMQVRADAQRRGLGRKMLAAFDRVARAKKIEAIFLTCGPHLEGFYGQIDFKTVKPGDFVPTPLATRRAGYKSKYGEQIIMCRRQERGDG